MPPPLGRAWRAAGRGRRGPRRRRWGAGARGRAGAPGGQGGGAARTCGPARPRPAPRLSWLRAAAPAPPPAAPGVGTRPPRLLRWEEAAAARAWVGRAPLPRPACGWGLPRGPRPSRAQPGFPPSCSLRPPPPARLLAAVTHDRASRAGARCPRPGAPPARPQARPPGAALAVLPAALRRAPGLRAGGSRLAARTSLPEPRATRKAWVSHGHDAAASLGVSVLPHPPFLFCFVFFRFCFALFFFF